MLSISLDEGYAFDILSILEIKITKCPPENKSKVINNYDKTKNEIINQIGEQKFNEIIRSNEYLKLINANEVTFNLVDKAKKEQGLHKEMDDSNYQRYLCKNDLQKKFFNNDVSEVKIGY